MIYPTAPVFNSLGLESNSPTLMSTAISGRMQSRKMAGQYWSFTASYPPLKAVDFKPVNSFVIKQGGQHGVFTIVLPVESYTSGTASGTALSTPATKGAVSVSITGLTGKLQNGDLIKFSGHSKVYMLTADRSDAGAIQITPALVEAVGTEQVIYNDVPFTVRLAGDAQKWSLGVGGFYKYEVDFIEALS